MNVFVKEKIDENEDVEFVEKLNELLNVFVEEKPTEEVYIFKINNWFDHKWLKFSGKGLVNVDTKMPKDRGVAIASYWKAKTTFPPFIPSRIVGQHCFKFDKDGKYFETEFVEEVHKYQASSENLNRRIANYSKSGMFIWYSANTLFNKRASLMVYSIFHNKVKTFFISFCKNNNWVVDKTRGIDKHSLAF